MRPKLTRAVVAVSLAILFAMLTEARAKNEESVWYWFEKCGRTEMWLEITLDGATIYKTTFPICKRARGTAGGDEQQQLLNFSFVPRRAITWEGYRDVDNVTKAGVVIEGGVWQAGADSDALILGLSFVSQKNIYMNTVHVAHPGILERLEIEPGLVVTTHPASEIRGMP